MWKKDEIPLQESSEKKLKLFHFLQKCLSVLSDELQLKLICSTSFCEVKQNMLFLF